MNIVSFDTQKKILVKWKFTVANWFFFFFRFYSGFVLMASFTYMHSKVHICCDQTVNERLLNAQNVSQLSALDLCIWCEWNKNSEKNEGKKSNSWSCGKITIWQPVIKTKHIVRSITRSFASFSNNIFFSKCRSFRCFFFCFKIYSHWVDYLKSCEVSTPSGATTQFYYQFNIILIRDSSFVSFLLLGIRFLLISSLSSPIERKLNLLQRQWI